jgi:hypothetical protein
MKNRFEGLQVEYLPIGEVRANPRNARTHSKRQIKRIAESIRAFGFLSPILIDDAGTVLAGHGRLAAANLLGFETVPTLRASGLAAAEKRAYVLADNKLAEKAAWDQKYWRSNSVSLPNYCRRKASISPLPVSMRRRSIWCSAISPTPGQALKTRCQPSRRP